MNSETSLSPRTRKWLFALLFVFSFYGLFDHSLWAPNDSREGPMIWESFASGHWSSLSLAGVPYLEKPPLLHWTSLVFCSLVGRVSEGLVRLPAALFGFGGLLLVHRWGTRLRGERAGFIGAFLCATSALYLEYSRIVLTDMCLTFMVGLALEAFWFARSSESGRTWRYALFLAAAAFAFYAKGVIGPGFVMVSVVAFLLVRREWKLALGLSIAFVPMLVAIVWPWGVALEKDGGREFLIRAFVDNQVGRFFRLPRGEAATSLPIVGRFLDFMRDRPPPPDPYFVHQEAWWYYAKELPSALAPWIFVVPAAMVHFFARGRRAASEFASFLKCTLVAMLVILHVSSTKVGCYTLPLFPIVFAMIGAWCDERLSSESSRFERISLALSTWILRVAMFAVPILYLALFALPLAPLMTKFGVEGEFANPRALLFAPGSDVAWRGAILSLAALAVAIFGLRRLGGAIGAQDRAFSTLGLVALTMLSAMLSLAAVIAPYDWQRTYVPIAKIAADEVASGRSLGMALVDERDVGEFLFYVGSPMPKIASSATRSFLEQSGAKRGVIVPIEELAKIEASLSGLANRVLRAPRGSGEKANEFAVIVRD